MVIEDDVRYTFLNNISGTLENGHILFALCPNDFLDFKLVDICVFLFERLKLIF